MSKLGKEIIDGLKEAIEITNNSETKGDNNMKTPLKAKVTVDYEFDIVLDGPASLEGIYDKIQKEWELLVENDYQNNYQKKIIYDFIREGK